MSGNAPVSSFELSILRELVLRPHGAPFREQATKEAILALSRRQLVCDPHQIGSSLFTRITEAGRAALHSATPIETAQDQDEPHDR